MMTWTDENTARLLDDEQTTDPAVRARLIEACDRVGDFAPVVLRQRIIRASRAGFAEYVARKGL